MSTLNLNQSLLPARHRLTRGNLTLQSTKCLTRAYVLLLVVKKNAVFSAVRNYLTFLLSVTHDIEIADKEKIWTNLVTQGDELGKIVGILLRNIWSFTDTQLTAINETLGTISRILCSRRTFSASDTWVRKKWSLGDNTNDNRLIPPFIIEFATTLTLSGITFIQTADFAELYSVDAAKLPVLVCFRKYSWQWTIWQREYRKMSNFSYKLNN